MITITDNGRLTIAKRKKGKPYIILIDVDGIVSTTTSMLLTQQNMIKLYEGIKQLIGTEPKEGN